MGGAARRGDRDRARGAAHGAPAARVHPTLGGAGAEAGAGLRARALTRRMLTNSQATQKGPEARRRPRAAREAYSLCVEHAAEGAVPPQMGPVEDAGWR